MLHAEVSPCLPISHIPLRHTNQDPCLPFIQTLPQIVRNPKLMRISVYATAGRKCTTPILVLIHL